MPAFYSWFLPVDIGFNLRLNLFKRRVDLKQSPLNYDNFIFHYILFSPHLKKIEMTKKRMVRRKVTVSDSPKTREGKTRINKENV